MNALALAFLRFRSFFDFQDRLASEVLPNELAAIPRAQARCLDRGTLVKDFAAFAVRREHQRCRRNTNPLEKVSKEIKHRIGVVGFFLNEAFRLHFFSALLAEASAAWEAGRSYLNRQNQLQPTV